MSAKNTKLAQEPEGANKHAMPDSASSQATDLERMTDSETVQGVAGSPDRTTRSDVDALQRVIGNRAVTHLIQTKLNVGAADDQYEQEADRVAGQVMQPPNSTEEQNSVQRKSEEPNELQTKAPVASINPLMQQEILEHRDKKLRSVDGFQASDELEQRVVRSQGSGTLIPLETRTFMEARFDSDFSDVRVHTDGEAAELNQGVQAKAFTHGKDIFFNDGNFNPNSHEGRHLLAHELTHVVQQRGSAPQRQNKLETSSSGNGHIDLLSVSAVQREPSRDLTDMAEAGEAFAIREETQNVNQPPAMRVSNVTDVSAARTLVAQIEGWRANMQEGAGAGGAFTVSEYRVTPAKMQVNEMAISSLDDYLITAGEQSRTLGSFQDALQKSRRDYERLKAQVTHLAVTNVVSGDATAGQIGQQLVQGAGFADSDAARAQMQRMERQPNSSLGVVHNQVQDAHDQMVTLGQQVGQKQNAVSQAAYSYDGALNNFKTGIPSVNDNPDQTKELGELKEKIEKVKKYVGKGLEYAGKGLQAAGVPGAEKAGENAGPVVDFLTDQFYDAELNSIQVKMTQYNTAHREHAINANLDAVRVSSRAFTNTIADFNNTVEAFAHAQQTFRDKLSMLGGMADAGHGDKYAQVASVLAEVDTYENQLDETLRLAYQEQAAAREAASGRRTIEGGLKEGGGRDRGMPYYEPYRWFHSNGGWSYECQQHELHLSSYGTSRGSAEGVANVGVNTTVDQAVQALQEFRQELDPMRRTLAQAMDLRMDSGMPTSAGGPAPTSRNSNQGL